MKKRRFVPIILMVILVGLFAVNSTLAETPPATKIDAIRQSKGIALYKEYFTIGKIIGEFDDELLIRGLVLYEIGKETQKVKGFELTIIPPYEDRSVSAYLDLDEVPQLLKTLPLILNVSNQWKNLSADWIEASFTSKDDFTIGFYHAGTNQTGFAGITRSQAAYFFFKSVDELNEVKKLFDKGIEMLNKK